MNQRHITAMLVVAIVVTSFATVRAAEKPPATIEVVGQANMKVPPDTARLSFAVETHAPKAQGAAKDNALRTRQLLRSLQGVLGNQGSVRTANYSLSPVYAKSSRLRPQGFKVTNWIVVETRQLESVGRFIDVAVEAGANSVGALAFYISQPQALEAKAAAEAVRQARSNAAQLADAAGLKITRILSVNYSPQKPAPVRRYAAEMAAPSATTPIAVGDIPIMASVTVVFETQ
jgi:uncharacterized protein YggE